MSRDIPGVWAALVRKGLCAHPCWRYVLLELKKLKQRRPFITKQELVLLREAEAAVQEELNKALSVSFQEELNKALSV